MRRDKTSRMINVCGGFLAERGTLSHKVPGSPLETKVSSTGRVKLDVVVSRLIITYCVIKSFINILRQMLIAIQGKRTVFDPEIKESIIVTETRLARLYRKRQNEVRWGAFSNFAPQRNSTRTQMVLECIRRGKRLA